MPASPASANGPADAAGSADVTGSAGPRRSDGASAASRPRILVVGASAAGLKAGARAMRLMPEAVVTVLERREVFSFGACGLPYYVAGDVDDLEELRRTAYGMVRDAGYFARVKGLDVRPGMAVHRLDTEARRVTATGDGGREATFDYDELVIATGAAPRLVEGVELGERVCCLHTPADARQIRQGLETGQVGTAVVVGGGFIGVEAAVALADMWGCEVSLVEAEDRLLPHMLDAEMAAVVASELARRGVVVHTGCPVTRVGTVADGRGAVVEAGGKLAGTPLETDFALVALGVVPVTDFAAAAGLALGPRGGLKVDDRLHTSAPHVWAAGDCVEVACAATGESRHIPLGSLANRQGRVVGDNLAGLDTVFGPVAGSACVKVFDLGVAATGVNETSARRAGLDARSTWGTFLDVAHYYPESRPLYLELVYEAGSLRVLGLQAVGGGDVVKRVDLAAGVVRRHGTLHDLLDLECCYSPPYNSALDPLHGLAATALNQERFGIRGASPASGTAGRVVLDVRSADEVAARPLSCESLEVPCDELRARLGEVPRDRPLLIACEKGPRSAEVARWLQSQGWTDVIFLAGGAALRDQVGDSRK
ncbi:MAG: FAD-dependent oxidoreductase [Candidatus Krumholzibacteriia bacterium]